jgi:hypothetical protein
MKMSQKRIKNITKRLEGTSLLTFCNAINEEVNNRGLSKMVKTASLEERISQLLLLRLVEKLDK